MLSGLACRSRGHEGREESSTQGVAAPFAPRMICDAATHDFGRIAEGDRPTHVFRVRNTGTAPLRIARVDPAYGCSVPNPPASVPAGEGADVEVVCLTDDRTTALVDDVVLHANDPRSPELVLEVRASIEPRLAFASRTVDAEMAFGETASREDRLTGKLASDARLRVEESLPAGGPEVTVVDAHDGAPQRLRFKFAGRKVGYLAGQTLVTTGLEKPERLTLLWSSRVRGNLVVEPTNPYIDLRAPTPAGVRVDVSSNRSDFRLEDAVIVEGPFEASFAPMRPLRADSGASPAYSVHVRVRVGMVADGERGVAGRLRVFSNDPAEPVKDVRVFALGAIDRNGR